MDNLKAHKVTGIREAIEAAHAVLLYLPPYSPELNPDELVWNDVKNNGVARSIVNGPRDLHRVVVGRLRFLQKSPERIRSFFQAPETRYAA